MKGLSGPELVRFTAGYLKPEALVGVSPQSAAKRAGAWIKAHQAAGSDPLAAIDEILPNSAWYQARLIHGRDEEELELSSAEPGAYGRAYHQVLSSVALARSGAKAVEAVIDAAWAASSFPPAVAARTGAPRAVSPLPPSERWLPEVSELESSHRYALDVFFKSVRHWGAAETGPVIRSVSSGIVVAASGDWNGGDSPSAFRSGGLSPKAGNGAIVYDPAARRYYAYFHLSDVRVRTGQALQAGDTLGRGGNTGVNARKKGHGSHLHIEIHQADGDAWTSYAIRDFIATLR